MILDLARRLAPARFVKRLQERGGENLTAGRPGWAV